MSKGMSNIYLNSSCLEKTDVLNPSIFQVLQANLQYLQASFWRLPTHADITEF